MELITIIECSDDLTKRLEDFMDELYRESKDGSEIVQDVRKLKKVILDWLNDSFEEVKLK